MNFSRSFALAAILGALASLAACSQSATSGQTDTSSEAAASELRAASGPGGPGSRLFAEADKDNDGKVTTAEVQAAATARFAAADKNTDGSLDASELDGMRGNAGAEHRAARHESFDKDGDGKVSRQEAPPRLQERFDAVDTNKDGQLDTTELSAMGGHGRGGNRGPQLARLDADGNGKVSAQEFQAHALAMLQSVDADGDGVVMLSEMPERGRGKRGGPGGEPGFVPPMVEKLFGESDADHDGKVTRVELDAAKARIFAAADANRDGSLDASELAAMRAAHQAGGAGDRIARLDGNGDGKVSKEEAPARLQERFDEVDANHDGQLTAEEMKAAAPAGGRGPGRGMHGQGPGARERNPGGAGPGADDARGGRGQMGMLDRDGDGKVTAEEFSAMPNPWFARADANNDGAVTLDELRAARPMPQRR